MSYAVKEIFYTLQGEGFNAGRPAVFCRFAGCNLWSGRERDRERATCKFCDTDFVGMNGTLGGRYQSAVDLSEQIAGLWPTNSQSKCFVVLTGGEPLLQLDRALIDTLHDKNFEIAIETNGTISAPEGLDWICVSPKARAELRLEKGNELKLVYPQAGIHPEEFSNMAFDHFFLQPLDDVNKEKNTQDAIDFCLQNPDWRLSIQTHKNIGIR